MKRYFTMRDDYSEKVNYNFSDYPIYISYGKLSWCPTYRFPSHWHDDIEFIAVINGTMDYNINGEIITLNKGEGVIVNTRQMHFGFSDNESECELLCHLLHPLLLCANPAYETEFVMPILNNTDLPYIKISSDVTWQKEIYDEILYIKQIEKEKTAPLKVQSSFVKIWSIICDNIVIDKTFKVQSADLSVIKNMVGFINTNYTEKITLKDIANAGGVGESKCCKLFKKYLNQTPNNYLTEYRLGKGLEFLMKTDLSVTEIANAVGFNSSSYFSECFKRVYTFNPRDTKCILLNL